jgi:hypothetical protein
VYTPQLLQSRAASNTIAAVKFSKDYKLEISVKNSGRYYTGASTKKKNTLHINMYRYTEYATYNGGIDCETGSSDVSQEGISACHLSLTKGNLLLTVLGGGENWG